MAYKSLGFDDLDEFSAFRGLEEFRVWGSWPSDSGVSGFMRLWVCLGVLEAVPCENNGTGFGDTS